MSAEKPTAPRWAKRVPKWKIARLYENDAQGLYDERLIDEVAYMLLDRCKSMLIVAEAKQGRALCPACDQAPPPAGAPATDDANEAGLIEHSGDREAVLVCPRCSWRGSWAAYRESFQGRHLIAPGLEPFCRHYIERLPAARTPQAKLLQIDWLIHRFHWEGTAIQGQPGATCLIQGRAGEVNAFLDALTAGRHRRQEIDDPSQYWSEAQLAQTAKWRRRSERRRSERRGRV